MKNQNVQSPIENPQTLNAQLRLPAFLLAAVLAAAGGAAAGAQYEGSHKEGRRHIAVDPAILDDVFGTVNTEEYRLPHNQPTTRGSVDTRTLPEALPGAVQDLMPRVVKIRGQEVSARSRYGAKEGSVGSGLRLDADTILTAQHVVADTSGQRAAFESETDVVGVMTNYRKGHSLSGRVKQSDLGGEERPIDAVHAFSDYEGDVALIEAKGLRAGLIEDSQAVTIRDIQAQPIVPGEPLYTISFGDNLGGEKRDPRQSEFAAVHGPGDIRAEMLPGQSEPKVIGGIAIGGSKPEDGIVVMPVKDYSAMPEPKKRNKPGDSGGALVDAQGRVVGVVSSLDATKYTIPSDMLRAYTPEGAKPPVIEHIEPSRQYYAQKYAPVSEKVIKDLAKEPPLR